MDKFANVDLKDAAEWEKCWSSIFARDLIDVNIVSVDATSSVEDACAKLLEADVPCLLVEDSVSDFTGLFDFADINAFLTVAASSHGYHPDYLEMHPQIAQIVSAARNGPVSVSLRSFLPTSHEDLSEKNPLETVPYDANIISLLEAFCRGAHRALVRNASSPGQFLGIVTDKKLLSWIFAHAQSTPALAEYASYALDVYALPSLHIYSLVVSCSSNEPVIEAMKKMSDEGVSSIAVLDSHISGTHISALCSSTLNVAAAGRLLSAIVLPSESKQILSMPLHQFISLIKSPAGSTDGEDRYPVYAVSSTSTLLHTMEKLIATNAHRLFVTRNSSTTPSPTSSVSSFNNSPAASHIADDHRRSPPPPASTSSNLCGIVSMIDVLSIFARLANVPDVDPTIMKQLRRRSSSSSHSSGKSRPVSIS
ncbi:hypothetical protein FISHEDRAFT_74735 [Fistulina hepatica ATCC 64428]|uniref:CBS domain-containing protein n=1 Tax=Fistulina hepatica ATCC 64428 TaxID=1128425 RepID=A0A0D7ABY2_9AGAR|nr:hypothetical protein FISHEDRAFT_74735 [Fistulina hepatica ATCC 64428]